MDYIALYRKWRPMTFDEVVEQDSVVTILKNTVKSRRIAHAYLFCGTRGTGKTSIAKIFSRAINCLNPVDGNPCNQCEICKGILNDSLLDVSEIDAASNNGVDAVRSIIDDTSYRSARAEYKVFIIDEVHMLSTSAFNALLKTLEEPPEKVVFILATTEPHKLPVTILSRCQRYDFKRISRNGISDRLREICTSMNITYDDNALKFIAGKADGAMRDAISLLDQTIASAGENITMEAARASTGSLDRELTEAFAENLFISNGANILSLVDRLFMEGGDPSSFISELISLLREILVVLSVRNPGTLILAGPNEIERLKKLSELTNTKEITLMIKELSQLDYSLKGSIQRRIVFEAGMLGLCDRDWSSKTELEQRIKFLEQRVSDLVEQGVKVAAINGVAVQAAPSAETTDEKEEKPKKEAPVKKEEPVDFSLLEQADKLDWEEFVNAAMGKDETKGTGAFINMNSVGYEVGGKLYIVFRSESKFKMAQKLISQEVKIKLEALASSAFGKMLIIEFISLDKFKELAPDLLRYLKSDDGKKEEDEAFKKSMENIAKLAQSDGAEALPNNNDTPLKAETAVSNNAGYNAMADNFGDREDAPEGYAFEPESLPSDDDAPEEFEEDEHEEF